MVRCGVREVFEWSLRWEFQGRGTLHLHIALWALPADGIDLDELPGRSKTPRSSPLQVWLQDVLGCMVDVKLIMEQAIEKILSQVKPKVHAILRTKAHYGTADLIGQFETHI